MAAAGLAEAKRLERYAELAVRVGANVQPGQLVDVVAGVEHAELVREVTRAAYRAGAAYVDVLYSDQHVRRAYDDLAQRLVARGLGLGDAYRLLGAAGRVTIGQVVPPLYSARALIARAYLPS